ncbi:unnamed protein product [Allacma fusca]|uniref:GST C-terminal domain-containing protein n=1 Tax=Allacma fusca TaxID=39272 RepID=A0A8J2PRV8_9HEXA|nr:unnamed protein product [Allacma fusca]
MPEPCDKNQVEEIKSVLAYFGSDGVASRLDLNGANLTNVKLKGSTGEGIYLLLKSQLSDSPKLQSLLGKTAIERALVRQWVDFNLLEASKNTFQPDSVLKELDSSLTNTFFAGNSLTLSDVLFYYTLYRTYENLTFEQKEKYPNLSRWLALVQEDAQLRQGRPRIHFIRTPLYNLK